jgi:hypothetical protein
MISTCSSSKLDLLPLAAVLLFCIAPAMARAKPRKWPKITPVERSYEFSSRASAKVDLPIFGADSQENLYVLKCRTPESGRDDLIAGEGDWQGEWQCELWKEKDEEITNDRFDNLLQRDVSDAPWHGRNTFYAPDVTGPCGAIPDFGRERHFVVRGMKITLKLERPHFTHPYDPGEARRRHLINLQLQSWDFIVSVDNDPAAIWNIPAPLPGKLVSEASKCRPY